MDPLRLHAVAARVAAWHNRHPFARRITAAQVQSIGYVALPFVAPGTATGRAAPPVLTETTEGGSLRERAAARAKLLESGIVQALAPAAAAAPAGPFTAAFSEDFIAPLTPRQVARWAAREGRPLALTPSDAPLREIRADAARGLPVTLYVLTAAVDLGAQRTRLLLGAGSDAAVLGPRLYSRTRLAAAAAVGVLLLALGLGLRRGEPAPAIAAAAPAASAASAVAVAVAASAPAEPDAPAASAATVAAVDAGASAPSPAAVAAVEAVVAPPAPAPALPASAASLAAIAPIAPIVPPRDLLPRSGQVKLPDLAGLISDEDKAAARAARRLMHGDRPPPAPPLPAATATAAAAPTHAPPPARAAAVPPPPARAVAASPPPTPAAVPPAGAAFAVSTRLLRTRAEAEQVAAAMGALLRTGRIAEVKAEILADGDDWRVVGWPYARRADAEQARLLLVGRGMRVEVVNF